MRSASHFAFSDQITLNSQVAVWAFRVIGLGSLNGRRGLGISSDYVRTLFEVALNGAVASSLTDLVRKYPEVQVIGTAK